MKLEGVSQSDLLHPSVQRAQGCCLQVVEGRCDGAHQGHEEKRHLENIFANEVKALDELIVPGAVLKAKYKAKEP